MKRYPIGTRVRVIRADNFPHFVGKTGRLVGYAEEDDYTIEMDGQVAPDNFQYTVDHPSIEPITEDYDGHETTTWDECPWQPEGVKQS